jgi:hypothetical protein
MQNSAWITLLRLMPPAMHNQLVLMTSAGLEFAVQNIFRMEEEYVVMRGRLSGTNDTGRLFLIPYDQINYIGVQAALKEADVTALYEGTYTPSTSTEDAALTTPSEEAAAQPEPEPPKAEPAKTPVPQPPQEKKVASRVVLLERVRARIAAQANKPKT